MVLGTLIHIRPIVAWLDKYLHFKLFTRNCDMKHEQLYIILRETFSPLKTFAYIYNHW